jgi:hypothetical protein
MELGMNGHFVADNSALTVATRSNIEGWATFRSLVSRLRRPYIHLGQLES